MVYVSPCNKRDYKALIQIEKSIFRDFTSIKMLESFEKHKSHVIWKIEEKKIIGFAYFFYVKDEIEIAKIGIIKSHQRKNYGSMLINEIKKLKIKKIFLEVSVQNMKAINFYFKNGFKKIGVRKGYYARNNSSRIDALRLILEV